MESYRSLKTSTRALAVRLLVFETWRKDPDVRAHVPGPVARLGPEVDGIELGTYDRILGPQNRNKTDNPVVRFANSGETVTLPTPARVGAM